jgi:hypothetical protein
MGNLQKLLKENEHLKNQNKGLLDTLRRRRVQAEAKDAQTAEALKQIEDIYCSYIGAFCLQNESHEVKISHADVKTVLDSYDVLVIETDDEGITFGLQDKTLSKE